MVPVHHYSMTSDVQNSQWANVVRTIDKASVSSSSQRYNYRVIQTHKYPLVGLLQIYHLCNHIDQIDKILRYLIYHSQLCIRATISSYNTAGVGPRPNYRGFADNGRIMATGVARNQFTIKFLNYSLTKSYITVTAIMVLHEKFDELLV